jgi:hypothetical protein
MSTYFKSLLLTIFAFLNFYNSANAQCFNGDVEANNFTNWTGWTGSNTGGVVWTTMVPGLAAGRHSIMNVGNDPILAPLGISLPMVGEGTHSIRLGNSLAGAQAEMIAYTFTVTDAAFSFKYAMVLQAPNDVTHQIGNRKPFFSYFISNGPAVLNATTAMGNIVAPKNFTADDTNPFFNIVNTPTGPIVYKGWQTECVNLSSYIGKTVTIYFTTADCALSGHYGYAYIDGLCKNNIAIPDFTYSPSVCDVTTLWVDGSLSSNAKDHYWKLEKLSNSSITSVIPGTAVQYEQDNTPPGYIPNLFSQPNFSSASFTPGYYKLTLGVRNCSGSWVEKSVVISVGIPELSVNQYVFRCCSDPVSPVFIANSSAPFPQAGTFNWYNKLNVYLGHGVVSYIPNGNLGFIARSTFTPPSPNDANYKVEYIDINGCRNEKIVSVINKRDFDATIHHNYCDGECHGPTKLTITKEFKSTPCNVGDDLGQFVLSMQGPFTYNWNTGATGDQADVLPGISNYWVVISNGCYKDTAYINLDTIPKLNFVGPPIAKTGMFIPTALAPSRGLALRFYHTPLPRYTKPAYNSNYYHLAVFNRYGQVVCDKSGMACRDGFENGEIYWDGKTSGGGSLDLGVYYWLLELKNCNGNVNYAGDVTLIR